MRRLAIAICFTLAVLATQTRAEAQGFSCPASSTKVVGADLCVQSGAVGTSVPFFVWLNVPSPPLTGWSVAGWINVLGFCPTGNVDASGNCDAISYPCPSSSWFCTTSTDYHDWCPPGFEMARASWPPGTKGTAGLCHAAPFNNETILPKFVVAKPGLVQLVQYISGVPTVIKTWTPYNGPCHASQYFNGSTCKNLWDLTNGPPPPTGSGTSAPEVPWALFNYWFPFAVDY